MVDKRLIYLTDRSAVETDDTCGMKFWWNRKEGGIGIVNKEEALPLLIGRETHLDLATVATMDDIRAESIQECVDDIISGLSDSDKLAQRKMELLYRRLGWLVAMALYVEPDIREQFTTVGLEDELILNRDPLWVAVTPDRILRNRKSSQLVYKEYKTTITAGYKWQQSWSFAIQLHIGLAAAEEELKQKIAFGQIMGLMKGYQTAGTNARLSHPYVWGYYNEKEGKWTHDYDQARSSNWTPMPVWEFPGGIVEWVRRCGAEVARDQFPHSAPVFLNQRMLDDWVARRVHREGQIRAVEAECAEDTRLRGLWFERRTKNCRPAFGDPCPYIMKCWNASVELDKNHPDFIKRVPHHDIERIGLDAENLG